MSKTYNLREIDLSKQLDIVNQLKEGVSDGTTTENNYLLVTVVFDTPLFRSNTISFRFKDTPIVVVKKDSKGYITSVTDTTDTITNEELNKEIKKQIEEFISSKSKEQELTKTFSKFDSVISELNDINNFK